MSSQSESSQQKIHGTENHVAVVRKSTARGSKLFARHACELRSHEYGCLILELQDRSKVVYRLFRESRRPGQWAGERAAVAAPQAAFCLTCSQTLEITTEPSPTAEATRFTDPARTSPTAKMPG